MTAGHLQEKNGYYYIVLSYCEKETGKRCQPWIPTGLPVKGNKKKAEKMLIETRLNFEIPKSKVYDGNFSPDMLFSDFMKVWFEIEKHSIKRSTVGGYQYNIDTVIVPYFKKTGLTLGKLKASHIQAFYLEKLKTVKPATVKKFHANIHKALKYAVKMDLIPSNEADKVDLPKIEKPKAKYFKAEEAARFLEATKNHKLSLAFQMCMFYGLRKSELVGLKWDAIDFERNSITICHTVIETVVDGKSELIFQDTTKTKSSYRTLPLIPEIKEKLLLLREQQEKNKKLCGKCYIQDYKGYVFVDPMGALYTPRYITDNYKRALKENGFDYVNFHGLRHSCASMMVANGEPMKNVQEWLGHSDISTTANIYSHLDYQSKLSSANTMKNALALPNEFKPEAW